MAGALRVVGTHFGDHLMPPRDGDNGKGFFEDLEVYDIHNRIFEQLGYTWDDLRVLPEARLDDAALKPHCDQLVELLRKRFSRSGGLGREGSQGQFAGTSLGGGP